MTEIHKTLRNIVLCDLTGVLVTLPHRAYVESRLAHPFFTGKSLNAEFLECYDRHEGGFGRLYEDLLVDGLQRGELQASALEGVLELFSSLQAKGLLSTAERSAPLTLAVYSTCLPRGIDRILEQTGLAPYIPSKLRYSSFAWSYRSSEPCERDLGDGVIHRDPLNRKTPHGFFRIERDLAHQGYHLCGYTDDKCSELESAQAAYRAFVPPPLYYWITQEHPSSTLHGVTPLRSITEIPFHEFCTVR